MSEFMKNKYWTNIKVLPGGVCKKYVKKKKKKKVKLVPPDTELFLLDFLNVSISNSFWLKTKVTSRWQWENSL